MAVLSIPNERWTDKREKKGLARNGLVQNPNKYSHGTHQDSRSTAKVIFPSKIKHLKAETLSKFLWMDMECICILLLFSIAKTQTD